MTLDQELSPLKTIDINLKLDKNSYKPGDKIGGSCDIEFKSSMSLYMVQLELFGVCRTNIEGKKEVHRLFCRHSTILEPQEADEADESIFDDVTSGTSGSVMRYYAVGPGNVISNISRAVNFDIPKDIQCDFNKHLSHSVNKGLPPSFRCLDEKSRLGASIEYEVRVVIHRPNGQLQAISKSYPFSMTNVTETCSESDLELMYESNTGYLSYIHKKRFQSSSTGKRSVLPFVTRVQSLPQTLPISFLHLGAKYATVGKHFRPIIALLVDDITYGPTSIIVERVVVNIMGYCSVKAGGLAKWFTGECCIGDVSPGEQISREQFVDVSEVSSIGTSWKSSTLDVGVVPSRQVYC